MSRRYWLPILAVVGLILCAQEVAQAQRSNSSTAQAQRAPETQTPPAIPPALQNSLDRIGSALEAANNKKTPTEETERDKNNLATQQRMADIAARMFYVGLAETIITFFGVLLVLVTLIYSKQAARAAEAAVREARKATKTTRQIGEAQVRAYLSPEDGTCEIIDEVFECKSIFRNSGQSPTKSMRVAAKLHFWLKGGFTSGPYAIGPIGREGPPIVAGGTGQVILPFLFPEDGPVGDIMKKDAQFFVCGKVFFEDVFGKKATVGFWLLNTEMGKIMKDEMGLPFRGGTMRAAHDMFPYLEDWEESDVAWGKTEKQRQQDDLET